MKILVSHTKVKVSYVEWQCKPEFARFDRMLKVFKEAADVAMYSTTKTNRMVARLQEIKAENDLYDKECPSDMPTVKDDVEVHTHATGYHEIVTQESRYVTMGD
ncbi:hypothetical protein RHSIM_Rhsim06G0105500 [Rhododendron simsii]|uniref:Uncharacterized protein n=1 Tax=Rhododendron simsii TaxID=118357 RepID=A0A834GWF0_RHOSS|nr:hypothetical protein RHSIM_Rhsim06G0105500 [Rhododendron simsii]